MSITIVIQCRVTTATWEVQDADATRDDDRGNILRLIANVTDPNQPPPESHPGYDEVNQGVRALFHGPALGTMATRGDAEGIRRVLAEGGARHVDWGDQDGVTPLWAGASFGHEASRSDAWCATGP